MTPPRAHPSSPLPPPGVHDLTTRLEQPLEVVVDTNVLLRRQYRAPLFVSARDGDLAVYWSLTTRAEYVRVTYHAAAEAAVRATRSVTEADRLLVLRAAIWRANAEVDAQLAALGTVFREPRRSVRVSASDLHEVRDPDDRHLFQVALAVGARHILSLDQRHLPHGRVVLGVRCWHPDTFLTLFYRQNPDAYARASGGVRRVPGAVERRVLP